MFLKIKKTCNFANRNFTDPVNFVPDLNNFSESEKCYENVFATKFDEVCFNPTKNQFFLAVNLY